MRKIFVFYLIFFSFTTPLFAQATDINCSADISDCPPIAKANPCRCDLTSPVIVEGSTTAELGSAFSASEGRPPYSFAIGEGTIDPLTGVILNGPECPASTTLSVTDACGQQDSMVVSISSGGELTLGGPGEPAEGDFYSASGGGGEYSYSFSGGSIDSETGEILSISECGGPDNNGAVGSVTVTDQCGNTASLTVRLIGGAWVQKYYEYVCGYTSTPNPGCGSTKTVYKTSGSQMVKESWRYSGADCFQCYCCNADLASGCKKYFDGYSRPHCHYMDTYYEWECR